MQKPNTGELVFFWILFGTVGLLAFAVMSPYLTALFVAGVFSVIFSPVHERIKSWVGGKDAVAALLTTVIVLFAILLPLIFLGIIMFQEVLEVYGSVSGESAGFAIFDRAIDYIERNVRVFVPSFEIHANIYIYFEGALKWVAAHLNGVFTGILSFAFQLFLMLIALFFFYRDGKKLREFAIKWSPLADRYDESIIAKIELAVSSVLKGALTTAIAQGILVSVGLAIFGVPAPVLWGACATIASLIPIVGTSLITIPSAVWLAFTGNPYMAVGLVIWALLCVGLVDNFINPYVINRGIGIHPFLILLSVLGGLSYFGPIGFLAGPIILAFFFALLDIYPAMIKGQAIKDDDKLISA